MIFTYHHHIFSYVSSWSLVVHHSLILDFDFHESYIPWRLLRRSGGCANSCGPWANLTAVSGEPRWLVVENDTQHQWNVVKLWEKPIGCRISMKFPAFEFWETRIKQEWNEHGTRYYVIPFGIHTGNKHLKIYCGRPENTTKISEAMALTAWCRSRLTSASMAIYCYVSIHPIPFSGIPFSGVFSHSFRLITWSNPKHVDDISDYQWYPSDRKIMLLPPCQ